MRAFSVLLIVLLLAIGRAPQAAGTETAGPRPAGWVDPTARERPLCGRVPDTETMIQQVTESSWSGWISRLSGEEPVTVGGLPATLTTRHSSALFGDSRSSKAYDYLLQTLRGWYPAGSNGSIEEDPFDNPQRTQTWKNLVLTIPGTSRAEEVVILSAHFDSMSPYPYDPAPGADDNASGSAALLEAARLLQGKQFPRTIRLIWFTGEEQGLVGSRAYASDHDLSSVVGVINLDMFAYDSNADRCFELHVGTLQESEAVAACITETIDAYDLDLSYDYLTSQATTRSDHASFWDYEVGAVLIIENFFPGQQPTGCQGTDQNPGYHTNADRLEKLNLATGLAITRSAIGALLAMADPQMPFQNYVPLVMN